MRNLTKTLAIVSLLAPASAFPLGIGEIKLHSALNQKLNAEIALVLAAGEKPEDIKVNLAPPEKFDEAGVPWTYFLSKVRFQTIRSNGNAVIKLTSSEPLKEPFLDFLLEVRWPRGNLYREFTVLVDPPSVYDRPAAPVTAQTSDYSYPSQTRYVEPQPVLRTRASSVRTPAVDLSSGRYGPTNRNDTLWKVAERVSRQTGISIEQTMMGLFEANPKAFYKSNVNALLAGKTLVIPEREVFLRLTRQQAIDLFKQQNAEWQNRAIQPSAVASSSDNQSDTESQLKLVAPKQEGIADATAVSGGVREEKEAEETAVTHSNTPEQVAGAAEAAADQVMAEKIANLEKQLAEMQKLIALRNEELAALQGQLKPKTSDTSQEPSSTKEKVEIKPIKKPEIQVPKTIKSESKQISQAEAEEFWGGWYYLLAGLGLGLIVYLAWVFWQRRSQGFDGGYGEASFSNDHQLSKKSSDVFQASVLEEDLAGKDGLDSESLFGGDFAVGEFDVFDIDQGEIDPVSEADVYMAYGRYQQAEELIRLAIKDQADRDDYKLKLLEIFFTSENKQAFENYSQQLFEDGKSSDTAFWDKVVEMGGEICPESTLFSANVQNTNNKVTSSFAETEGQQTFTSEKSSDNLFDDIDFDLASFDQLFGKSEQASVQAEDKVTIDKEAKIPEPAKKEDAFLDFDEPVPNNQPIDFDLEQFHEIATSDKRPDGFSSQKPEHKVSDNQDDKNFIGGFERSDLSLSESSLEPKKPISFRDSIAETNLDDDFDFNTAFGQLSGRGDGGNLDEKDLTDIDELEIQLDLALAYVDMGDKGAAKDIATQVLENGSPEQKMVAQSILENL